MKQLTPILAAQDCLRVTEAYECSEGEGRTAGARTFLVRLSGCNLRCWWCDSKYSSFYEKEAVDMPWRDLASRAQVGGAPWMSITGGEPTWRGGDEIAALAALCAEIRKGGTKVKLETNGLAFPSVLMDHVDLWSVSPKWDARKAGLGEAGVRSRTAAMDYDEQVLAMMLSELSPQALQIKLVICFGEDGRPMQSEWLEAACLLESLPRESLVKVPVFLIPQAYEKDGAWNREAYLLRLEALEEAARNLDHAAFSGLDLRVQAQRHRVLHGDKRGV